MPRNLPPSFRDLCAAMGACLAAGLLAGGVRGGALGLEVLRGWEGAPPANLDLLWTVLYVGILYLPLAGVSGIVAWALICAWCRWRGHSWGDEGVPGRLPPEAAGLAWWVFLWLALGGVLADEVALDAPLGGTHLLVRAGVLVFAVVVGGLRARSSRPGPWTGFSVGLVLAWGLAVGICGGLLAREPARGATAGAAGDERPPDLLFLLVDTLRADHLGAYGYQRHVTSPALDSLAIGGTLFESAYAQWSRTAPSHATLFSGRYPHDHGLIRNGQSLSDSVPVLAEQLAAGGYRTAAFFSNPFIGRRFGFDRGFEVFVEPSDFSLALAPPAAWLRRLPLVRFMDRLLDRDVVESMAVQWLQRATGEDDRPVALFVQWVDPHMPYRPRARLLREMDPDYHGPMRGRRAQIDALNEGLEGVSARDLEHMVARYDAEIRGVDQEIARVLQAWRSARVGPSLVVMTADHGENMLEHEEVFRHPPDVVESLCRVPLIFSGAGGAELIPSGRRVKEPVELADVAGTVAALLGIESPGFRASNLVPWLRAGEVAEPGRGAVSEAARGSRRRTAYVSGGWKLVLEVDPAGEREFLWDLGKDPNEQVNQAQAEPARRAELRAGLDGWFRAQDSSAVTLLLRPQDLPEDELDPRTIMALRAMGYL